MISVRVLPAYVGSSKYIVLEQIERWEFTVFGEDWGFTKYQAETVRDILREFFKRGMSAGLSTMKIYKGVVVKK